MTELKLSLKGKVVTTIAVIVSFIILAWPFSGSKDAYFHNNMLAIVQTIISMIYLIWQMNWHDHYKKLNPYPYSAFESDEIKAFRLQQLAKNKKQYVLVCTICTIANICLAGPVFVSPGKSPINLFVGLVMLAVAFFLTIYALIINITKLSFFTFSHIKDFYESFDFTEFILNLPVVSGLFEQPVTKEKEKPTKKINL
jgi:hypothetical protein